MNRVDRSRCRTPERIPVTVTLDVKATFLSDYRTVSQMCAPLLSSLSGTLLPSYGQTADFTAIVMIWFSIINRIYCFVRLRSCIMIHRGIVYTRCSRTSAPTTEPRRSTPAERDSPSINIQLRHLLLFWRAFLMRYLCGRKTVKVRFLFLIRILNEKLKSKINY